MTSRNAPAGADLSVTIIVPTYNRPVRLAQCLAKLARLEGGPYRTIVVDDGGERPVDAICQPYRGWVELVRRANGGPAAARNTGAHAARGADLLAFIDDDCSPQRDWIVRLVAAHGGVRDRLVGGRVDNALPDNVCSSASQTLCSYLYDYYQASGSEMTFFTSNNLMCRRDDFIARGGFDEDFPIPAGEDRDFGIRWQEEGGELVYAEDAAVDHAHHLDLGKFWRQHSNYGKGARQLHLTMDRRGDARPKLERTAFYVGMFTYPFRARSKRPFTEAVLVGLSQVAMVAGYFSALLAERRARPPQRANA
jgi:GT2 family glycosyltransferase